MPLQRSTRRAQITLVAVATLAMVASALYADMQTADAAGVTISITTTVVGETSPSDFEFVITPELDGCGAQQTVTVPGAGGDVAASVVEVTGGALQIDASQFTKTPIFNDVTTFEFELRTAGIGAGMTYTNPPVDGVDYEVFGVLTNPTPSGFPAFNLVRAIAGPELYTQGSSLDFGVDGTADLSDGLQLSELTGADPVFVLNAREVDTGRYHPPILELNSDGTGRIQNSDNTGGINPQTLQLVDVDKGDEYIIDLLFDPADLTIAATIPCTYTVTQIAKSGYSPVVSSFTGLVAGDEAAFSNVADVAVTCGNKLVTIDMTQGATGMGTAADDVILGTAGDDDISGLGGDDTICGEGGNDTIFGGDGRDFIYGGTGDDTIDGGLGIDRIWGNAGADVIDGGGGSDRIRAGSGNDTVRAGSGADRVWGGDGDDNMNGMGGQDRMWGEGGNDVIQGNWQSDQLYGGPGNDIVRGAQGKDRLYGESGDDELFGGDNTDYLDGGDGIDLAHGQRGWDNPIVTDVSGCIAETKVSC